MSHRRYSLAVLLILAVGQPAGAGGIGVLGDSYSDEYQFYGPDRSTARNWVEILGQTRGLDFGEFATASRGEPRNQGFAFNWSRSNASSDDLIASGQHTGLAEQVARGEVATAVVFIGGNDAIHALERPNPSFAGLGAHAAENVELAVRTLLNASPEVRVLLVTVPDIRDLPEFRDRLRTGAFDRRLADAAASEISVLNARIRKLARTSSRVALLDFDRVSRLSSFVAPRIIPVADLHVDRTRPGNAVDRLFLQDRRHLGTVGQGMLAKLVVDCLNTHFQAAIPPLEDREVLSIARGLMPTIAEATENPSVVRTSFGGGR